MQLYYFSNLPSRALRWTFNDSGEAVSIGVGDYLNVARKTGRFLDFIDREELEINLIALKSACSSSLLPPSKLAPQGDRGLSWSQLKQLEKGQHLDFFSICFNNSENRIFSIIIRKFWLSWGRELTKVEKGFIKPPADKDSLYPCFLYAPKLTLQGEVEFQINFKEKKVFQFVNGERKRLSFPAFVALTRDFPFSYFGPILSDLLWDMKGDRLSILRTLCSYPELIDLYSQEYQRCLKSQEEQRKEDPGNVFSSLGPWSNMSSFCSETLKKLRAEK